MTNPIIKVFSDIAVSTSKSVIIIPNLNEIGSQRKSCIRRRIPNVRPTETEQKLKLFEYDKKFIQNKKQSES